ncbi:hypothetical protein D3C76_1120270 [compost metagenome]
MCWAGRDDGVLELDDLAFYRWRWLRDDLGGSGKCADVQWHVPQSWSPAGGVHDGLLRGDGAGSVDDQQTADRFNERPAVGDGHGAGSDSATAVYPDREPEQ